MSSIYIQEPSTSGKVLLKTTVGDIDIELWTKECPKTCRNFLQLCIDGYYNNTLFDRVVKGFIVQGGNGNANELISEEALQDEFHSRLRYTRRGLVGMVNSEECDNSSQFFFTMAATPELQNKNTLFGKVTGDTVFNMLKLEEGLVDLSERPCYPQKIIQVEILSNPFEDIIPRKSKNVEVKSIKKKKEAGIKNFALLSFGEEAKEDEEETTMFVQTISSKGKSFHDVNDTNETVLKPTPSNLISEQENNDEIQKKLELIKEKFKTKGVESIQNGNVDNNADESDCEEDYLKIEAQEKRKENELKKKGIQDEIQALKKQYQKEKKTKDIKSDEKSPKELSKKARSENLKEFNDIQEKYKAKKKLTNTGQSRDEFTLNLLSKFRKKLENIKEKSSTNDETEKKDNVDQEIESDNWLNHTLCFNDTGPIVAKDASTKSDDWYDHDDSLRRQKRREKHRENSSRHSKRTKN